ncbi:hypothetical protein G3I24_40825, partial [Micromonospora aurantiaca]|nr:hypothetical protein [Micromonospora aurantiaca]
LALIDSYRGQDLAGDEREILHELLQGIGVDAAAIAPDGNPDMPQIMEILADRDDALATLAEDDLVNVYRNY